MSLLATTSLSAADLSKPRVWTNSTGKFTVEATLISHDAAQVTLKKTSGETISLPLDKLSLADRELLHQAAKTSAVVGKEAGLWPTELGKAVNSLVIVEAKLSATNRRYGTGIVWKSDKTSSHILFNTNSVLAPPSSNHIDTFAFAAAEYSVLVPESDGTSRRIAAKPVAGMAQEAFLLLAVNVPLTAYESWPTATVKETTDVSLVTLQPTWNDTGANLKPFLSPAVATPDGHGFPADPQRFIVTAPQGKFAGQQWHLVISKSGQLLGTAQGSRVLQPNDARDKDTRFVLADVSPAALKTIKLRCSGGTARRADGMQIGYLRCQAYDPLNSIAGDLTVHAIQIKGQPKEPVAPVDGKWKLYDQGMRAYKATRASPQLDPDGKPKEFAFETPWTVTLPKEDIPAGEALFIVQLEYKSADGSTHFSPPAGCEFRGR